MKEINLDLPDDLRPLMDLSALERQFREPGGSDVVESRISAAIAAHPHHGIPLAAWAWYLARQDDYAGAILWQTRAIEKGPDMLRIMWRTQRAGYRFRAGDWKAGFHEFGELIASDPANPVPRIARSFEMKSMGDHVSGELDEMFAMHMVGHVETEAFFGFLRHNGPFSTLERLRASLFVLSDPLDASARIHRGEMFISMGSPMAAFYDLHLADALEPRNLGLLARIEDIRIRGIQADPPLYEVKPPVTKILPAYEIVLGQYAAFLAGIVLPPRRGKDFGWIERVLGKATDGSPIEFDRSSRTMISTGQIVCLTADLVAIFGIVAIDAFDVPRQNLITARSISELSPLMIVSGVLAGLWGAVVTTGSLISSIGAIQIIFRCRVSDMTIRLLEKRWFYRIPIFYGFILTAGFLISLVLAFHGLATLGCLWLLSFAAGVLK
jgi:hypothetical protein